jgi:polyferredoxin
MEELIIFAEILRFVFIGLAFYCGYKAFKLEKEKNSKYKLYLYAIPVLIFVMIVTGTIFSYLLTG